MSRVLMLAYHFPPVGGGGVQRPLKFARYLPDFGHEPIVVTGPGPSSDRWTPEDVTLSSDLPPELDVRRISVAEPPARSGWRASAEWRLMRPTRFQRWWTTHAVDLATEVGRDADVIVASLVPYESARAAAIVAQRLGKPWIADLQDPWAFDEMWPYPSAIHRQIDVRRMRATLRSAAVTIMNTPEAAKRVKRAFPELERILAIPNGYDAADFADVARARDDGRFRIVHTGYLHTDQGLRFRRTRPIRRLLGGSAPVDILPRSHVFLLAALEELGRSRPETLKEVEVVLAGVLTQRDREIAETSPVNVRMTGYVPHAETVELQGSADALFLPMHDLPAGMRAGLVPGKTYEYLASGTPIVAAVPDGDARDILLEAGNAHVCRPTDVSAIARSIDEELRRWRAGEAPRRPRRDVVERYERRRLTSELARVIDSVGRSDSNPRR